MTCYIKKKTIDRDIYIPISEIKTKRKYVMSQIKTYENTCINNIGYVTKVNKIKKLKYSTLNHTSYDSNVVYNVSFDIDVYDFNVGDKIMVTVVILDDSVCFGKNDKITAIIHTDRKLTKGQEVEVVIQAYEYDTTRNIIKIVAKTT